MSALSDVMMWATRVIAKKDAAAHEVLDIKRDANLDEAQAAFHKIARIAHPDLHRTTLEPDDLELVTTAYSRAAAAYQDFRTQRMSTTRLRPLAKGDPAAPHVPIPSGGAKTPRAGTRRPPTHPPPAGSPTSAATAMSSKALIYYRKAELSLRRGDLKGAMLQLKMAIAADPQSTFLRTALAEVEAEVQKAT